jgi:CDGSH-type Zn-finger protein/uncharacterized Fe-S cluster protein YjdI
MFLPPHGSTFEESVLRERIISYRGKKILVKFNPDRCTHVAECLMGAPDVFDNRKRPWVDPDAAPPDEIARVVLLCPTGALHFKRLDGGSEESVPERNTFTLVEKGPLNASGNLVVKAADGTVSFKDTRVAFCRCGASKHKPFCDNRHDIVDFEERGRMGIPKIQDGIQDRSNEPVGVTLSKDGPLLVSGPLIIVDAHGMTGFRGTRCSLCRCGATKTPPFCDGNHSKIGFRS